MYFQVRGLTAVYGKSRILQGVDLELDRGEMVALMGRNGVGKSTTLKAIMGIVRPTSGNVNLNKHEITGRSPYHIARLGLGYVPEERRIFPRLTVRENLLMGQRAMRGRRSGDILWDLTRIYDTFSILKTRENLPGVSLSGGEQQMLTIARTLMGNPDLILVDEPTEGLAPLIRKQVGDILLEINRRGVSILLVEQNMNVALSLCARAYVMSKGRIVFSGTSDEVRQADDIRHRYLEV